jgi:hypothetical protein
MDTGMGGGIVVAWLCIARKCQPLFTTRFIDVVKVNIKLSLCLIRHHAMKTLRCMKE